MKDGADLIVSELKGCEFCVKGKGGQTDDFRFEPCIVRALHNRVVEIIGVALVLILKFVKEVKEVEQEQCRRTNDCGRKPVSTKELNPMRPRAGQPMTKPNDDTVNSIQLEDHVVIEF